jgi:hypothetical protein
MTNVTIFNSMLDLGSSSLGSPPGWEATNLLVSLAFRMMFWICFGLLGFLLRRENGFRRNNKLEYLGRQPTLSLLLEVEYLGRQPTLSLLMAEDDSPRRHRSVSFRQPLVTVRLIQSYRDLTPEAHAYRYHSRGELIAMRDKNYQECWAEQEQEEQERVNKEMYFLEDRLYFWELEASDELNELLDQQEQGEEIDEDRLFELELFDRHRRGEELTDDELEVLEFFKKRRDEDMLYELELFDRHRRGEELTDDELEVLEFFKKRRGDHEVAAESPAFDTQLSPIEEVDEEAADELNELLDQQEQGEEIDEDRLFELELFDRHRHGKELTDDELEVLEFFKKRRGDHEVAAESPAFDAQLSPIEEVNEDHLYSLELVDRRRVGEDLTDRELDDLELFELELFDRHYHGEELTDDELEVLEFFKKRRDEEDALEVLEFFKKCRGDNEVAAQLSPMEWEATGTNDYHQLDTKEGGCQIAIDEDATTRLKAEEEARLQADEDTRAKAEKDTRLKDEEDARLQAVEKTRVKAEDEARRQAKEEARLKAEEENTRPGSRRKLPPPRRSTRRAKAEEDAMLKAEEDARLQAVEKMRVKAEDEARRQAEEEARLKAEEETTRPGPRRKLPPPRRSTRLAAKKKQATLSSTRTKKTTLGSSFGALTDGRTLRRSARLS